MTETQESSPKPEIFSAAQAVAAGTDFAELRLGAGAVFWNEFRPQDAACRLWEWRAGDKRCLTPNGFSVRSRVYEYGGGSFCVAAGGLVFVNEADQQLYLQPLAGGMPSPLTQGDCRYGGLEYANGQVLAVEEQGDVHRLVSIAVADGQRQVLAEGADFYASPCMSPDGASLAWIEWDRPHQPWTETRLMCREGDGPARCISAAASQQQPRFDVSGRLGCLSDAAGFWQPWVQATQGWAMLQAPAADHAGAPWQLGACTWLPVAEGHYLATWFEDGFARLGLRHADGTLDDYSGDFTRFRSLAMDEHTVYAIASSPSNPGAVIAIDRLSRQAQVLAGGQAPLPVDQVSYPRSLCYPSGEGQAHGFFYPAMSEERHPPLVVLSTAAPPRPATRCSTRASSTGPSVASPWPISTTAAAAATAAPIGRRCTCAGGKSTWKMPAPWSPTWPKKAGSTHSARSFAAAAPRLHHPLRPGLPSRISRRRQPVRGQ